MSETPSTVTPRQKIGQGAATGVLVRKAFRVLRMGGVPRAIAND